MLVVRSFSVLSNVLIRSPQVRKFVNKFNFVPAKCCSCSRLLHGNKFITAEYYRALCTVTATQHIEEEIISTFRSSVNQNRRVQKHDVTRAISVLSAHDLEEWCAVLLRSCVDLTPSLSMRDKVELACHICTQCTHKGHSLNVDDMSALLEVYATTRHPVPGDLLASLDPALRNNPVIQLRLLQCAAETGDLETSACVLGNMKKLGVTIGEEVFASLILGHGRAGDYSSVQSMLNTMLDAALPPGATTYVSLLQAQLENQQPIRDTLKQMQADNIGVSEQHIVKLLHSVAMSNRYDTLDTILSLNPLESSSNVIKNCVIQLLHQGYASLAVKVICNVPSALGSTEQPDNFLAFLPYELVHSNQKTAEILQICEELQRKFPSHLPLLLLATEASLRDQSRMSTSIELLRHVHPVRVHYLWPLVVRSKDPSSMVATINMMQELGLRVDFETLAFYVFPNLLQHDTPIALLRKLQLDCRLSVATLLGPLLHALLSAKMLEQAVVLCKQYRTRVLELARLVKPLVAATLSTAQLKSGAQLLSMLSKSKNANLKTVDVVGVFVLDFTSKCKPEDVGTILKLISEERLLMGMSSYEIMTSRANMKPHAALLNSITNTQLEEGTSNLLPHPRDMSLEELEAHLVELRAKQLNVRGILRRLLQLHCRLNNATRAMQIKQELDAEGFQLSAGILASLLGLYLNLGDLSNAGITLKELYSQHPTFNIDEHKILDFCTLRLREGASQSDIEDVLKQFVTHNAAHGVRGGVAIARNCDDLVATARQRLGDAAACEIQDQLKSLRFL